MSADILQLQHKIKHRRCAALDPEVINPRREYIPVGILLFDVSFVAQKILDQMLCVVGAALSVFPPLNRPLGNVKELAEL